MDGVRWIIAVGVALPVVLAFLVGNGMETHRV
jgi:hypothetical protein